MTCPHCLEAGEVFGPGAARWDAWMYRLLGPRRSTRRLIEMVLRHVRRMRFDLIDVGGGVGAVQHALAMEGANRIYAVDASPAYLERARAAAARLGYDERVTYLESDIIDVTDEVPECDVVTLDRVICCYPDVSALIDATTGRAGQLVGLVFPRNRLSVRVGLRLVNLFQRIRGRTFRVYLHPVDSITDAFRKAGFERSAESKTLGWTVWLMERSAEGAGAARSGLRPA